MRAVLLGLVLGSSLGLVAASAATSYLVPQRAVLTMQPQSDSAAQNEMPAAVWNI